MQLEDFGQCLVGNREPNTGFGKRLAKAGSRKLDRIKAHPNAQLMLQTQVPIPTSLLPPVADGGPLQSRVEGCFSGCVVSPSVSVECLLNVAVNGKPWEAVSACIKAGWGTPRLQLEVPELGDLSRVKEDVKFFLTMGLYKAYRRSGPQALYSP